MTDSCVEKPWRKIAGKNGREKAHEKLQEKTPLKIGAERRKAKGPKVQAHLEATLAMLKERHGKAFKFTLMVRHESPTEYRDGAVYIVSNDPGIAFKHGVLGRVIQQGLAGSEQEGS